MHGHFIPPPHCAPDHFFLSVKSPSLTAAYAPAKKPMKLEPIRETIGITAVAALAARAAGIPLIAHSHLTTKQARR